MLFYTTTLLSFHFWLASVLKWRAAVAVPLTSSRRFGDVTDAPVLGLNDWVSDYVVSVAECDFY